MNDQKENMTSKWRIVRLEKIRKGGTARGPCRRDDSKEEHWVIIEMQAWIMHCKESPIYVFLS